MYDYHPICPAYIYHFLPPKWKDLIMFWIRAVYDTKSIQEDEAKKLMAMKNVVLFVILAK